MNNDIKEIIESLLYLCDLPKGVTYSLNKKCIEKVKDYITNLQNTNKNHSKKLIELGDKITNLQEEKIQLEGKIKQLEHNCKQASDSCRQHRLASKNHIRRLKRREQQINIYKSRNEKAIQREMELSYLCDTPPDEELLKILEGSDKE